MAKGLNRAEIIGRLGQEVEIRYSQSGTAVANISVATNYSIKRGDQWEEAVEWHRVTIFGKMAEACAEYLSKGSQAYISGRLQTRSWEDKDGVKRWATEIVAQDVIFLDSKGQGQKSDRPPAPPVEDEGGEYKRSHGGPDDGMTAGPGNGSGQAGGYDASEENKGDEEFGGMGSNVPF